MDAALINNVWFKIVSKKKKKRTTDSILMIVNDIAELIFNVVCWYFSWLQAGDIFNFDSYSRSNYNNNRK